MQEAIVSEDSMESVSLEDSVCNFFVLISVDEFIAIPINTSYVVFWALITKIGTLNKAKTRRRDLIS